MNNLEHYIRVYDNALPGALCNELINHFEDHKKEWISRNDAWELDYRKFNEINIVRFLDCESIRDIIYQTAYSLSERYMADTGMAPWFPGRIGFEELRMKKYENNDLDQFGWHTDVNNYPSARRFLVCFFYLNTVDEGGKTEFLDGPQVTPEAGRVIMFPPMWMYPHIGHKPISSPKYIISTYFHYAE